MVTVVAGATLTINNSCMSYSTGLLKVAMCHIIVTIVVF